MSDDNSTPTPPKVSSFTMIVIGAVIVALALMAAGLYFYTQPGGNEPVEDQTESIDSDLSTDELTPDSVRSTIQQQLEQLQDSDFDQGGLSDQALGIN